MPPKPTTTTLAGVGRTYSSWMESQLSASVSGAASRVEKRQGKKR